MATRKKKTVTRKLYNKRAFINDSEGLAAIDGDVKLTLGEKHAGLSAYLTITDCSNQICLDFEIWESSKDVQHIRLRRKKAKRMRTMLNDFLDAVELGLDEMEEKLPAIKAALKAEEKARKDKKKKKNDKS